MWTSKWSGVGVLGMAACALGACGCAPRMVTFSRNRMIPPDFFLPKRLDVLAVAVAPRPLSDGLPGETIENKLAERLVDTRYYQTSVLRDLATTVPNYAETTAALIETGRVAPELRDALKQRGDPPGAIVTGKVWVREAGAAPTPDLIAALTEILKQRSHDRRGSPSPVAPASAPKAPSGPTQAVVSGTLRAISLDGRILCAANAAQTVRTDALPSFGDALSDAFLKKISPTWEQTTYSLCYDCQECKAACYILKAIGPVDPAPPDDLKPVQELLASRLTRRPNDDCALFLTGIVHELLLDWEKAKDYYNRAIIRRPCKEYSDARERVSWIVAKLKHGEQEMKQLQKEQEERLKKEAEAEFKDYDSRKK